MTVRSDVGQNTVPGDGRFFGDVRIDGGGSKEFIDAGEREGRQQYTEAPHCWRGEVELVRSEGVSADILYSTASNNNVGYGGTAALTLLEVA